MAKPTLLKIKKSRNFKMITEFGKKDVRKGLILQVYEKPDNINNTSQNIRFGITASKKIGKAVIRNRARRRLNALANKVLTNSAKTSKDYVLIARNVTANMKYYNLEEDLRKALSILGCIRNKKL